MTRFHILALAAASAVFLLSSCVSGPQADVQVRGGANLGQYEIIFVNPGDAWIANHTITGLLMQELQRRGYAVKLGVPPAEALARSMTLTISQAGSKRDAGAGANNKLRFLTFELRSAQEGVLATASYDGETLDPIGQKQLTTQIADQLFGP